MHQTSGCPRSQAHYLPGERHGTKFLDAPLEDPGKIWNSADLRPYQTHHLNLTGCFPHSYIITVTYACRFSLNWSSPKIVSWGVVGQLAPQLQSTSGSPLAGGVLTILRKGCNPTKRLLLVMAHQPGQEVPRLFKRMHLFLPEKNHIKSLPLINAARFRVPTPTQMLHILF